jgi:hypothetical protein
MLVLGPPVGKKIVASLVAEPPHSTRHAVLKDAEPAFEKIHLLSAERDGILVAALILS